MTRHKKDPKAPKSKWDLLTDAERQIKLDQMKSNYIRNKATRLAKKRQKYAGLTPEAKAIELEKMRRYTKSNRSKINAKKRENWHKNRDRLDEEQRQRYQSNKKNIRKNGMINMRIYHPRQKSKF